MVGRHDREPLELSLRHETPPVLLFQNIKGYPADRRVVVNVRADSERVAVVILTGRLRSV